MAKKEEKQKPGKYTREEFGRARRKVLFSAARWGAAGALAGKGYEVAKDWYNQYVQPAIKTSNRGFNALEKGGRAIGRELDHAKREAKVLLHGEKAVEEQEDREWKEHVDRINKEKDRKQKENIGRRGFFKSVGKGALDTIKGYAGLVHNYPVATFTVTGAAYGAIKRTITIRPEYLTKKDIAILKDKDADYDKRLQALETYRKNVEASERAKEEEIQEELSNLAEILDNTERKSGTLETIVEEPRKGVFPIIATGLAGIILTFLVGTSKMTGFAILPDTSLTIWNISLVLFTVSLILIYVGIKKKRIKIVKRNSFRFE